MCIFQQSAKWQNRIRQTANLSFSSTIPFLSIFGPLLAGLPKHQGIKKQYDNNNELDEPLASFNNKSFINNKKTLKHNRGHDVVDYQSSLCYEYEDLLFDGKSPSEFSGMEEGFESAGDNREFENNNDTALESGGDVAKDTAKRPRLGKCKKVCKNDFCKVICAADKDGAHFVKVLVGVVLPLVTPTGVHTCARRPVCRRGREGQHIRRCHRPH